MKSMTVFILVLILTTFNALAQTQLRGRSKIDQYEEQSYLSSYSNSHDFQFLLQFQQPTFESAPMDMMLFNHEMEIARMMGTPGVIMMHYQIEDTPSI